MSTNKNKYFFIGTAFSDVWPRIQEETPIKYLKELGIVVGVTQQNVSARKQENLFPYGWAYLVGKKFNLLTEWILTGEGPKRIMEPIKFNRHRFEFLEDLEDWLSEMVEKEPEREEWAKLCIFDALPAFKEWKKRKESDCSQKVHYPEDKVA